MDMPIRFDILEYTKLLMESGLPRDQAEAHAVALSQALGEGTASSGELVLTKQELLMRMEVLKQEILARMEVLRRELLARMEQLKEEMLARIDVLKQELYVQMDLLKQDLLARMDRLKQELLTAIDFKIEQLRAELMPKINLAIWLSGLSLLGTLINSAMLVYLIAHHPI